MRAHRDAPHLHPLPVQPTLISGDAPRLRATARVGALAAGTIALLLLSACGGGIRTDSAPRPSTGDAEAIAAEREIGTISGRAVGVPPFAVSGTDRRLEPLGYALADLLATDLARSDQLTMVERTRLGDVLRELDLSASGRLDPATAPRVGRLVSARRLVFGAIDELPGNGGLRLGVRLADVESGTVAQAIDAQAPLVDILDAQKALSFRIFDALGVTLTPAERAAVAQKPTSDLAALLAYGSGVQAEYAGDYRLAASEYRRAARLDGNFSAASTRAQEVRARSETGVSIPISLPGLRPLNAAVASTIDRINRPLDQITTATSTTGAAADPAFPTTTATVIITVTRP